MGGPAWSCSASTPLDGALGFAFVRHIHGLLAVDELLQVIALGDDDVVVPVALLDRRPDLGRHRPTEPTTCFLPSLSQTTFSPRTAMMPRVIRSS